MTSALLDCRTSLVEGRASRDCVALLCRPSGTRLCSTLLPALTCRAFLCRRFAAGGIARAIFLRPLGLRHRLGSPVQPGGGARCPTGKIVGINNHAVVASVQPFLPFEVAERSYICQRKRETILILVTHRSQREAPVFHAQSATVPVVTRLRRRILQRPIVRVKTEAAGGTQATLVELTVAKQHPKLVENILARRRRSHWSVDHAQKGIASANGKWAVVVVHQCHAGIDAAGLEVVIEVPFGIGARAGFDAQAGNDGSEAPCSRQKRDAGEIRGRRKHVPLPCNQRIPKRGIEKILLSDLPTQDLPRA